jgi:hypothetical protein
MVISESTAAALALLTRAADDPDIDLEERMHAAIAAVEFAVTSYLGLTLTITVQGHEVSFTAGDHSENQAGTSLRIPLSLGPATEAASTLTLFAATPGAFVDLAADLSYALGTPNVDLALDEHLAEANNAGVTGLAEYSVINQAAGVLINRGHTEVGQYGTAPTRHRQRPRPPQRRGKRDAQPRPDSEPRPAGSRCGSSTGE